MQIASVPPPIVSNVLPQDVTAKAVPNLQAAAPLVATPVTSAPKSENFNQRGGNSEKAKEGGKESAAAKGKRGGGGKGERGSEVNIRV